MQRHYIVIPLAALLAISPLLVFGTSCGHDIGFHMQSWVDAAAQLRHGTLYPRWAFTPAWQAGEPRFTFYPPLSWMFGALLTLVLPMPATPNFFIYAALVAAGFSMHAVVRRYTSAHGALLAACVYLANPYMFFNAFERSAYAELLASIWIPLLFLAVLRRTPPVAAIALGLTLAWLTNVPAGIMATYTLVALACVRCAILLYHRRRQARSRSAEATAVPASSSVRTQALLTSESADQLLPAPSLQTTLARLAGSLALGLTLPAFYLLPAAVERRFVQSSMVMIENLRYQDNTLFHRTSWEPHNVVTHTVSLLAVAMLIVSAGALVSLYLRPRQQPWNAALARTRSALLVLFALILFLLLPISGWVWHFAPELPFLQFPWRLLTVLSAVLAVAVGLMLRNWQARWQIGVVVALVYVGMVSGITSHLYRQACEIPHMAQYTLDVFRAGHGVPATDEYTPGDADNDLLRTDSPGYWLATPEKPDAYAAGTIPNPNEYDTQFDGPIPYRFTKAEHPPSHFVLNLRAPAVLVLNLRDFPNWHVRRNGALQLRHLHRDDGLIAFAVPAGLSDVDIAWHRSWDVYAGDALSALAASLLLWLWVRERNGAQVESTVPA